MHAFWLHPYLRRAGLALGLATLLGSVSAGQILMNQMGTDNLYTPTHALIMATPFWYSMVASRVSSSATA